MTDAFRQHRYSGREVRRILRRAARIADDDPTTRNSERALTVDELERAASELGLPSSAIAAALRGSDEAPSNQQEHSIFLGAPTRLILEEEVEGEPSEEDREDLIEEIRTEIGATGSIESVGKTFIWRLTPGYRGRGRNLSVRLRSRDGKTRIIIEESLGSPAAGLFLGLGIGGGIGPMGAYILAIIKLGVVGAIFPALWIPLMLILARTIFVALAGRRERSLRKLMDRLREDAERWSHEAADKRLRVAANEESHVEGESEGEGEEPENAVKQARR